MMATEEKKIRKTYPQEWSSYNKAQVNEKSQLQHLLYELCQSIEEPPQVMGRPRSPLSDLVFASCLKVYECMSGRRAQSDMREALQRGYLSKPVKDFPCFTIRSLSRFPLAFCVLRFLFNFFAHGVLSNYLSGLFLSISANFPTLSLLRNI
jgi:hypothetical protein